MTGESHPLAATILGLLGTICWCIQLFPQIYHNWRRKSTEGLPAIMFVTWALSGTPFGIYATTQSLNLPLQIQPQIFLVLCAITWVQCLHYSPSLLATKLPARFTAPLHRPPELRPKRCDPERGINTLTAWVFLVLTLGAAAGVEAVAILRLRHLYPPGSYSSSSTPAAITAIGILASVLLALGLLPPYVEIWRRRGRVVGISWLFLGIDWLGAALSLGSLGVQTEWDETAGAMYAVCLALETGIFGLGGVDWARRRWGGRKGVDQEVGEKEEVEEGEDEEEERR
ncbi:PQ-loop-domain-containing protein [Ascodesmis nigricans]|uniref:PQ-loop-domain-containing protein n=1 Tax=Ascodesmis nigricans TaxID=341454 RepID=A0A4S2MMC0_9PEZI|nr:PQ-loop-domain-containing protein [Ascodesmis nigricans]